MALSLEVRKHHATVVPLPGISREAYTRRRPNVFPLERTIHDLQLVDDLASWEKGISRVAELASVQRRLKDALGQNAVGRVRHIEAWQSANLTKNHAVFHETRIRTRQQQIDTIDTAIQTEGDDVVRQSLVSRRRSLMGWQTRDRHAAESSEPTAAVVRRRDEAQKKMNETSGFSNKQDRRLEKRTQDLHTRIATELTNIASLPMVTHPQIYGHLDGPLKIDYGTTRGSESHKLLFLLSQRHISTPEAAEVIARHVVDGFEGDYHRLAHPEFRAILDEFAGQFNDEEAALNIKRAAVSGLVTRLRNAGRNVHIPMYDPVVENMTHEQLESMFDFFGTISDFQKAAQIHARADGIKHNISVLQNVDVRKQKIDQVNRALIGIRATTMEDAYAALMQSPFLKDVALFGGTAESDSQRKRTALYAIPGLSAPEIDALIDFATTIGGRRDISSTYALGNLLDASALEKNSPEYARLQNRIRMRLKHNGQLFDQSDAAKWALEQDARRDSQRMPLPEDERKKLELEVSRRTMKMSDVLLESAAHEKERRSLHFPTRTNMTEDAPPTRADVWLSDVLRRTAELALSRDNKVTAMLAELHAQEAGTVYQRVDASAVAARLFQYVYDRLPWWQQGKAGYHRVDGGLFAGMASRWVQENGMKGIDMLKHLDETSPARLAELFNPSRFGLTQKILDEQHAGISK